MGEEYSKSKQLKKLHEERRRKTDDILNMSIVQLSMANEEISIATVSRKANISRKTIYNRKGILDRIRQLQGQQTTQRLNTETAKKNREEKIVESYERKLKKASLEIDKLKKELEEIRTLYYRSQY